MSKPSSWYDADYFDKDPTKGYPGPYTLQCAPWARLARAIVVTLGPLGCASAVDFGCARGFVLYYLQRMGWKAHGYDFSAYAVRTAMEGVDVRQADIMARKFRPEGADLGIAMDLMEHVDEGKVPQVLAMIAAASAKLVLLQIVMPDSPSYDPEGQHEDHVTVRPREWWMAQLKDAGLRLSVWDGQYKSNVRQLARGTLGDLWAHGSFVLEHEPFVELADIPKAVATIVGPRDEWLKGENTIDLTEEVDGGADTEAAATAVEGDVEPGWQVAHPWTPLKAKILEQ